MVVLSAVVVFLAGLLAGEEFIVRWGVHPALRLLDDVTGIRARQALIRRLRVLVPILFGLATATAIVALVLGGVTAGLGWRLAGLLALVTFAGVTIGGTVPINEAAFEWSPENPPENWKALVTRWERVDVVRSSAAAVAFALWLVAFVANLG